MLYLVPGDTHDGFQLYWKLPIFGWPDTEAHQLYVACIRWLEPIGRNAEHTMTFGPMSFSSYINGIRNKHYKFKDNFVFR
jgi:hypothetical protein